ncbi:MAG: general secretion pathway protein GspK [Candidatus Aureabacteria bacterium]|nr:general secretion pathway protein GspK [Candidatus Auribacterota bacterium]
MSKKNNQKAFILVTAVWIIMIISVITVLISYQTRLRLDTSSEHANEAKMNFIAKGIITKIAYDITKRDNQNIVKSSELFLILDYSPSDIPFIENLFITVSVKDEERMLNLNSSDEETLERFFYSFDLPENASACLLDWIDSDDDDTNNGNGAEQNYYSSLEKGYSCKNAPLSSPEEILFVKDIDNNGTAALPFFTVFGNGKINFNTVNRDTLVYIGLSEILIDKILDYRKGEDFTDFTEDDQFFESPEDIIEKLGEICYSEEIKEIEDRIDLLSTNSNYFKIELELKKENSKKAYNIVAIIRIENEQWEIVSWKKV